MNCIHLICFPYAGGSSMMYYRWRNNLPSHIQLHPIELSGRGRRMNEPLYTSMEQAVEDAYLSIPSHLFEEKIVLFGYSMGSLIAYELAHYIKEKQGRDPAHLFVAARKAPHITKHKKALHALPHDKFVQEMLQLGGMSREVFENKELAEIFVPLLRSDLQIVESYQWEETREPLNTDITVLTGADDVIPIEHMHAWHQVTKRSCTLSVYPGDHFFIHQQYNRITEQIARVMSEYHV